MSFTLIPAADAQPAPRWQTQRWFNAPDTTRLSTFKGRVIALHAFQMLCPGCVSHGMPQALRMHQIFGDQLAVVGLHTVFEHHAVMGPPALQAFIHEYRLPFPIGVDQPGAGPLPKTMQAYAMRGTPSVILIDGAGRLRAHAFGRIDDMVIGAAIGTLLSEDRHAAAQPDGSADGISRISGDGGCDADGCALPQGA